MEYCAHPHAVTGLSDGSTYTYDANGSMISRTRNGVTTTFTYNAENKLVLVQEGGNTIAQFSYDGDGNRVQSTISGVTTQFVGEYYEVSGTDVTKYYDGQTSTDRGAYHPRQEQHPSMAIIRLPGKH